MHALPIGSSGRAALGITSRKCTSFPEGRFAGQGRPPKRPEPYLAEAGAILRLCFFFLRAFLPFSCFIASFRALS